MPKLRESEFEKADRYCRESIVGRMAFYDSHYDDLAKVMDCSERTARNKVKKPETLTVAELRNVAKRYNITAEEICKMLCVTYR